MANIASFPLVVAIAGDSVSTTCVVSLGYTPNSAVATAAYDANFNSVLGNIASVTPGVNQITINFTAAFSGTIQVVLAVTNSVFSSAQLQPVTQATSPWVANITQVASTVLGAPQIFGTVPTGVVIGTSSDLYVAGTRARSNQTTTAAGVQDVNIVGSLGATNSVTNGTFAAITDNTTKVGVIVGTAALKTDLSSVAGTATITATAGVQKVGVVGNTAATLDAAINGAASTNALWTMNAPSTASAAAMATPITTAALTVVNIKASAGNLYGISVNNTSSTPIFIQFYNTAGTPVLGTSVIFSIPCVIGVTTLAIAPLALANFTTGIGIGASTSPLSTGTPSVAPTVTVFFK